MASEETCPRCKGNGRVEMLEHCPACGGSGLSPAAANNRIRELEAKLAALTASRDNLKQLADGLADKLLALDRQSIKGRVAFSCDEATEAWNEAIRALAAYREERKTDAR